MRLLLCNELNIRKSILEMQFWLQAGVLHGTSWRQLSNLPMSTSRLWWLSQKTFFKSEIWRSDIKSVEDKANFKKFKSFLLQFQRMTESLTLCDVFEGKRPNVIDELCACEVKPKDSVSLKEVAVEFSYKTDQVLKEIQHDILNRTATIINAADDKYCTTTYNKDRFVPIVFFVICRVPQPFPHFPLKTVGPM